MKICIILIVFMLGVISLGNANNTVTEDKLTVHANTENGGEKTIVVDIKRINFEDGSVDI